MPRSLDLVLTSVAAQLMEATAATATQVSQNVLEQLVEQFDVDGSFCGTATSRPGNRCWLRSGRRDSRWAIRCSPSASRTASR